MTALDFSRLKSKTKRGQEYLRVLFERVTCFFNHLSARSFRALHNNIRFLQILHSPPFQIFLMQIKLPCRSRYNIDVLGWNLQLKSRNERPNFFFASEKLCTISNVQFVIGSSVCWRFKRSDYNFTALANALPKSPAFHSDKTQISFHNYNSKCFFLRHSKPGKSNCTLLGFLKYWYNGNSILLYAEWIS